MKAEEVEKVIAAAKKRREALVEEMRLKAEAALENPGEGRSLLDEWADKKITAISPELRSRLKEAIIHWHSEIQIQGNCAASNEGLFCCCDPNTEDEHYCGAELDGLLDAMEAVLVR